MNLQDIYIKHYPLLLNIAKGVMRNKEDAEDIIQDLFLVLPKKLERYQQQPNIKFETWLGSVTRNFCIDNIRREKNKMNKGGYDVNELTFISSDANTLEDVSFRDLLKNYNKIIDVLSIREREILHYVINDFSYRSIEKETGESDIYVKSTLHIARKNFIEVYASKSK